MFSSAMLAASMARAMPRAPRRPAKADEADIGYANSIVINQNKFKPINIICLNNNKRIENVTVTIIKQIRILMPILFKYL